MDYHGIKAITCNDQKSIHQIISLQFRRAVSPTSLFWALSQRCCASRTHTPVADGRTTAQDVPKQQSKVFNNLSVDAPLTASMRHYLWAAKAQCQRCKQKLIIDLIFTEYSVIYTVCHRISCIYVYMYTLDHSCISCIVSIPPKWLQGSTALDPQQTSTDHPKHVPSSPCSRLKVRVQSKIKVLYGAVKTVSSG